MKQSIKRAIFMSCGQLRTLRETCLSGVKHESNQGKITILLIESLPIYKLYKAEETATNPHFSLLTTHDTANQHSTAFISQLKCV